MKDATATNLSTELVVVSAESEEALVLELGRLTNFIDRIPDASITDIAYTCSLSKGPSRIAFVVPSAAALRARCASARDRIAAGATARIKDKGGTYWFAERLLGKGGGKLAFVFPGAPSFYPDMLRDLVVEYPECRAPFDNLEEALADNPEFTPSNFIFPAAPYYSHDADIFSSGAYSEAFISTTAACVALSDILKVCGVKPDGIVGCAGGELAAAYCSGSMGTTPRSERIRNLREVYRIISKAIEHGGLPAATMVSALPRKQEDLQAVLQSLPENAIRLAVDFSPKIKTFAIDPRHEDAAIKAFAENGVRFLKLELDRPFNTPDCAPVATGIRKFAANMIKTEPSCEVWSCGTTGRLPTKPRLVRDDMAERWMKPVRFSETIRAMFNAGYTVFVEVGPRGLMSSAIEETLAGEKFAAIALNSIHRRSLLQFQHGIAQLAAQGADMDISPLYARRGARKLDFDSVLSLEMRHDSELRLSRAFPKLMLVGDLNSTSADYLKEPKGRGAKVAARAAAKAAREGFRLQFESGVSDPLISDAPPTRQEPGLAYDFTKNFRLRDIPFVGDFAYGSSQLSYSDPNLRGLVMLPLPFSVEVMAETSLRVVPNKHPIAIENFLYRRQVAFNQGTLTLSVHAERTAAEDPKLAAVKVSLWPDAANGEFTWPFAEATVILSDEPLPTTPSSVEPLSHPRTVHWSGRDIYPFKLGYGRRLRGIVFAESWSEGGLDYQIEVPALAGNVSFTRLPIWVINPLLLHDVASGFKLWRCNEKFAGAFSFPFRFHRMELRGHVPKEGTRLNCYLRLAGVTPRSHLCDITVTDGNGGVVMQIDGWEEQTERVPKEYCEMVLQPATAFLSEKVSNEILGNPSTDVASAVITNVPYEMFERNEQLWLKILGYVVLNSPERKLFSQMKGSVSRKTEWLFGRIAAKEAVRRYLRDFHQARWSYADVQIWSNEDGKPQAIGAWGDGLTSKIDIAIAHTAQFVVAIAASNARVGVDVESAVRNLSEEFTFGVFTQEEIALATKNAGSSQSLIRFWCAKEAVSKALGTGIRYSPREMIVSDYIADIGKVEMKLTGAWVETFKNFSGRTISVSTRIMRDHVIASCFIPASLFSAE